MHKYLYLTVLSLIFLTSCNAEEPKLFKISEELISKKYFVKGMTCGGCIIGVKTALGKADDLNIQSKDISVGEAVLQFEKSKYQNEKTDCEVSKTIEKYTEFKVFLDKNHTQKACKS